MIKRVRIQGFKSLKDVEVELFPLTVLFGPNASGKSNLLDALQLLSAMGTRETLLQAFDPPFRGEPLEAFSFGPGGIEEFTAQERLRLRIEVDVQLSKAVVDTVNRQVRPASCTTPQ